MCPATSPFSSSGQLSLMWEYNFRINTTYQQSFILTLSRNVLRGGSQCQLPHRKGCHFSLEAQQIDLKCPPSLLLSLAHSYLKDQAKCPLLYQNLGLSTYGHQSNKSNTFLCSSVSVLQMLSFQNLTHMPKS